MTNQQKIEFYLNKGFAVEVEFKEGKDVFYFQDSDKISGLDTNGWMISIGKEAGFWNTLTKVTPIPPKPYEFKVGERVMVIKANILQTVKEKLSNYNYLLDGGGLYYWWELAPALPEEEECEVVEVKSLDAFEFNAKGTVTFTKPGG